MDKKIFVNSANRKSSNSWAHSAISKILKFLRCASPQIANPQISMIFNCKSQIANFFTKYCALFHKTVLKSMYFQTGGSFESAKTA